MINQFLARFSRYSENPGLSEHSLSRMESTRIESTKLPPCSLSLNSDDELFVGTYDLEKSNGVRTGSLDLYNTDLVLKHSVSTDSAVLDTKLVGEKLYSAHSTGDIRIWDTALNILDRIQLKPKETLITQIELHNELLAATTTTGELLVYDLNQQQLKFDSKIHDLEAWTVSWQNSDHIFTGGDDRQLTFTDLRVPYTLWKIKSHEAGVTSILPDPAITGNCDQIWTGGYDDMLNSFDVRSKRVVDSTNLSGGVWRLIPNPSKTEVLACCMYGGLEILNAKNFRQVDGALTNHESMVYGGLWLSDTTGITCSFYDKMLQKWNLKCNV